MNIALWIVQGILAFMFLMAGFFKSTQPVDKLSERMPWVNEFPSGMVRFIGVSELLIAIGLIAPQATGILQVLTPVAAVGLGIIMVLAAIYHSRKKEFKETTFNIIILLFATFVAFGRV